MRLILSFCVVIAMTLSGCITQPRAKRFPPPPSEEVRANLGRIGIVPGTVRTNTTKPRTRAAGAAAALWGLQAGAQAARGGGDFGALAAMVVWAVTVPLGTVVGAAIGANEGMSAKQRTETEEQLRRAVLSMNLQEKMTQKIFLEAEKQTGRQFVNVGEQHALGDQAGNFSITNVDTFLEVTVWNVGLC